MAEETIVATPQEPTPAAEQPVPFSERVEKLIADNWSRVTEENATEEPAAAELQAPAGSGKPSDETKPQAETAPPEDGWIPPTPEQTADTKFWGGLDKAGWERMERDFPVATAHVKAAIAAGSRFVNEARKAAQQPPAEAANAQPTDTSNAELLAAMEKANSLDPKEAAEGLQKIVDLRLKPMLKEYGLDPVMASANRVYRNAYASVVEVMPEIAKLDPKELDAVVDSNPALLDLLDTATDELPEKKRIAITASVMKVAAQTVVAKKASETATNAANEQRKIEATKAAQRKVNSNANIVSNVVVESPAGGAPKGKKTVMEIIEEKWPSAAS